MRIAQVAPLFERVPPPLYGGTERVVSYLTEELVRQGHDVTLFASGDSVTSARLVPACPRALWRDPDVRETLPYHVRQLELVLRHASRFDVVHFHTDYVHFPLVRRCSSAMVTTMHGRVDGVDVRTLLDEYRDVPLVALSRSQRLGAPEAQWIGTVPHGLPRDLFTFRDRPGDYLLFVGRLSPEKRVDRAIEIARRVGLPLMIAAKIYPEERAYFDAELAPLIARAGSSVQFVGEVGDAQKDALLGGARALLFPVDWPEPFGLAMVEAMACGTPVIAWPHGAVPEVLEDEVTGYIVETVEQAVLATRCVGELNRARIRRVFEQRFDAGRMAASYVDVYRRLLVPAARRGTIG